MKKIFVFLLVLASYNSFCQKAIPYDPNAPRYENEIIKFDGWFFVAPEGVLDPKAEDLKRVLTDVMLIKNSQGFFLLGKPKEEGKQIAIVFETLESSSYMSEGTFKVYSAMDDKIYKLDTTFFEDKGTIYIFGMDGTLKYFLMNLRD